MKTHQQELPTVESAVAPATVARGFTELDGTAQVAPVAPLLSLLSRSEGLSEVSTEDQVADVESDGLATTLGGDGAGMIDAGPPPAAPEVPGDGSDVSATTWWVSVTELDPTDPPDDLTDLGERQRSAALSAESRRAELPAGTDPASDPDLAAGRDMLDGMKAEKEQRASTGRGGKRPTSGSGGGRTGGGVPDRAAVTQRSIPTQDPAVLGAELAAATAALTSAAARSVTAAGSLEAAIEARSAAEARVSEARGALDGARAELASVPTPGLEASDEERAGAASQAASARSQVGTREAALGAAEGELGAAMAHVASCEADVAAAEAHGVAAQAQVADLQAKLATVSPSVDPADPAVVVPQDLKPSVVTPDQTATMMQPHGLLAGVSTSSDPTTPIAPRSALLPTAFLDLSWITDASPTQTAYLPVSNPPAKEVDAERKKVLDQKAQQLRQNIDKLNPITQTQDELLAITHDIRDPKEAEYLLRTYNETYAEEGKGLTTQDLVNRARTQMRGDTANVENYSQIREFQARIEGRQVDAAQEKLNRLIGGDFGKGRRGPGPGETMPYNEARKAFDEIKSLDPASRQQLFERDPRLAQWVGESVKRQLTEKERRDWAVLQDTNGTRSDALNQIESDELETRRRALQRDRRIQGLSIELTPADEEGLRSKVEEERGAFAERAEKLAAKREQVRLGANDLRNQPSPERTAEILEKAGTDPEYRRILAEEYGKSRPRGEGEESATPLELLRKDLVTQSGAPSTWERLKTGFGLWGTTDHRAENNVVGSKVDQLIDAERSEAVRQRLQDRFPGMPTDTRSLSEYLAKMEQDPNFEVGLKFYGVSRDDLVAFRDAQERTESDRKAADFVKSVKDGDASKVVDALDSREDAERRQRLAREKERNPERAQEIDAELTRMDVDRDRRQVLFEQSVKRQTDLSVDEFTSRNIQHDRMEAIVRDASKRGYVDDTDLVYVASKAKSPERMAKVLKGKTPDEIAALNERMRQRYADADLFSRSGINLRRETADNQGYEGPEEARPLEALSAPTSTDMLERAITNCGANGRDDLAMRLTLKGDPEAIYDAKTPPTDPAKALEARKRRLQVETQRDDAVYQFHRNGGVWEHVEDWTESVFKFDPTGASADQRFRELQEWRRQNLQKLEIGDDPALWEEYARRQELLTTHLEDNAATNRNLVKLATDSFTIVGVVVTTLLSAGGATALTVAAINAALGVVGVGLEHGLTDGGLSKKEIDGKLAGVIVQGVLDLAGAKGLDVLKNSGNARLKQVATLMDDFGGVDFLKKNASDLLTGDKWRENGPLKAMAELFGETGRDFVVGLLTKFVVAARVGSKPTKPDGTTETPKSSETTPAKTTPAKTTPTETLPTTKPSTKPSTTKPSKKSSNGSKKKSKSRMK